MTDLKHGLIAGAICAVVFVWLLAVLPGESVASVTGDKDESLYSGAIFIGGIAIPALYLLIAEGAWNLWQMFSARQNNKRRRYKKDSTRR